jgi:hypothetical protein
MAIFVELIQAIRSIAVFSISSATFAALTLAEYMFLAESSATTEGLRSTVSRFAAAGACSKRGDLARGTLQLSIRLLHPLERDRRYVHISSIGMDRS